jgi:hypothetical protein
MTRVVKQNKARQVEKPSVRRVSKSDGKLANYSSLKASTSIVLPEIKRVLLDRQKKESQSTIRRGLYPSEMSMSDWCPRSTYYRMSGLAQPETRNSFQLENVFAQGNSVHSKWQGWLESTNKLWGDWKCSRCAAQVKDSLKPAEFYGGSCIGTDWVKFEELVTRRKGEVAKSVINDFAHEWKYREVTLKSTSLPLSGHADGGLTEHNILIELKSISAGSFRFSAPKLYEAHIHDVNGKKIVDTDSMWKDFHAPLTSHLKQLNLYLFMAAEMNLPFTRGSFVYELKANNQVKEFVVPYSYSIIEPVLEIAHNIVDCLAKGSPPDCIRGKERCSSCKSYEGGK